MKATKCGVVMCQMKRLQFFTLNVTVRTKKEFLIDKVNKMKRRLVSERDRDT